MKDLSLDQRAYMDEMENAFNIADAILRRCQGHATADVLTGITVAFVEAIRATSEQPLVAARTYLDEIWRICTEQFAADDAVIADTDPDGPYPEARAEATFRAKAAPGETDPA